MRIAFHVRRSARDCGRPAAGPGGHGGCGVRAGECDHRDAHGRRGPQHDGRRSSRGPGIAPDPASSCEPFRQVGGAIGVALLGGIYLNAYVAKLHLPPGLPAPGAGGGDGGNGRLRAT